MARRRPQWPTAGRAWSGDWRGWPGPGATAPRRSWLRRSRRPPQHGVATLVDIAQAQRHRLDLILGQGRQEEPGTQDIADAPLAADRRALGHEVGDVAVDGALRNVEVIGQLGRCDGVVADAEGLEEGEEAEGGCRSLVITS